MTPQTFTHKRLRRRPARSATLNRRGVAPAATHLALLERWADQAALDVHAKLNATRLALRPELREREDDEYKRTR